MICITHVHMEGGEGHEHIASVRWRNPATGATGENSKASMVDWVNDGGDARVSDGQSEARVGVVDGSPPYLRTYADNSWTNNLLALPRF